MSGNKEYLNCKETAELLGISVSTLRRWSDTGDIQCYRVGKANYRKYKYDEVAQLKRKMYGEESVPETKTNSNDKTITENITAQAHPAHYLMHKYWGRKAHNVVSTYISTFTQEGDTILEPFMGSGVTVIESIKLNRKVIGIDINPISTFIVENTINNVDLNHFASEYTRIRNTLFSEFHSLYETVCPYCGQKSYIETAIWENDLLVRIKGVCPTHGVFITDARKNDIETYDYCTSLKKTLLKEKKISYPTDNIMQYVKRSGRKRIDELFTDRALIILSRLRTLILEVQDASIRNLLLFCFTSMLSNVSRMLPGDKEKATYKSGWVISKFWTPKINTERNIYSCLDLRYSAILKGKRELEGINSDLATLYTADASKLSMVDSNSIDYIFTDPPYGESIAYLALSHFWNSWLSSCVDYDDEIIIDPYRNKGYEDYAHRTEMAYSELFRVLKDGHYMSFTFNNRDLNVWKAILDACKKAGFILENIVMQEQAVSSGTQGINRKNTLTGDFVYNFKKDTSVKNSQPVSVVDATTFITDCINEFIESNNGATPTEIYEYIIPIIVENDAYTDSNGDVINIEKILKKSFDYVETVSDDSKLGESYKWIKNNKKICALDLFAGAGGMSEGVKKAGIDVVAAIEFNKQIAETYEYNHPETKMMVGDIRDIDAEDVESLFDKKQCSCNVIFGGPPCQGFSMAGNRIRSKVSFLEDPRNLLFKEYIRMVERLRPEVFVIENVPGILNYNNGAVKNEIYSTFKDLGYKIDSKVLCAADYGVPQLRQRAIFIGNRLGISPELFFPEPTHTPDTYVTVYDAISDLPPLEAGQGVELTPYQEGVELTEYQRKMVSNNSFVYNHMSSNHKPEVIELLKLIKQGETMKDLPEKYHTKSVHSGAYGRMDYSKPAYTLTTRLNTPSVGRITHPIQNRTITPREAARIQSFPDEYRFLGDITSVGMQIGNAVPPLLAQKIAERIIEILSSYL